MTPGWPPGKATFPWVEPVAAVRPDPPGVCRLLTGGVWSRLICAFGFLPFSQTLLYNFLLLCLPTQVFKLFDHTQARAQAHTLTT